MSEQSDEREGLANLKPGTLFAPRRPDYNVDPVDRLAGIEQLKRLGYTEPRTVMVIDYALTRWTRGEEAAAEKGAIDRSFHGIDLTSWRVVLAAAVAAGTDRRIRPGGDSDV